MTWWAALYDELLADVLLDGVDPRDAARTVDFLRGALALAPGARVFDQCCGTGRLAVPLAQAGFRVVGVDQAAAYVARAARAAREAGVAVELHAGDALDFVPDAPCDGALNWWTSFGYALDDATNARMLARAFDALRPGGRLALDTMNLPGVLRAFAPEVTRERGGITLVRHTSVDLARGTMDKLWRYTRPSGAVEERTSTVRLYLPHAVAELLTGVGFVDLRAFGDVDGAPLRLDSPRCIWVAARPSAA